MNGIEGEYGQTLRTELDERIRDAQIERQRREKQWDINVALYHGDHQAVYDPSTLGEFYATSNQIQGAVITQVAVMTERPVRPVFVPRETNEPPEIFLKPESAYKVPPNAGLSDEQMAGADVIPEPLFDFLSAQTMPQEVDNPRAGEVVPGTGVGETKPEVQPDTVEIQVPIFDDEDFIFVDDALCAEALTQEHDSEWEMCSGDEMLRQAITQASIIGHQDFLVQWNEQDSRFDLMSLYPYHTWIDRWSFSTRDCEYYVMRRVVPMSEAFREFPEHQDELATNASTNTETGWWGGVSGGKYDSSSDRSVVEIFTTWTRNHPYPMDAEEAMGKGLIRQAVEEPLVDPETNEIADMGGQPLFDEQGVPQFVTAEGEPTNPEAPNWPVRYGIHQTTMVGSIVLYEGEAEFADIPVARIKNVPIVESPYGQGEPQRLASLQDLKNRLWSIYHDYVLRYRSPEQAMPASVLNELEEQLTTLNRTAGRKLGIPDDIWNLNGGNVVKTIELPQLTAMFHSLMQLVTNEMNDIAGTVDVLRGEAKSEWSGELFQQATNAARGPIGFKARGISEAVKHAAKVTAGLIIDFLPLDEWSSRNKKYPPQVLEVMRRRLKRVGYDVSVEVGGASSRDSEGQKLVQMMHNNPQLTNSPTFMQQVLEHVGVKEGDKIVREVQSAMQPPPQ